MTRGSISLWLLTWPRRITIDEDDLEKNTKIQGEGKKLTSRDKARVTAGGESSVTSRDISVAWTAPETNGVELLRVARDLIAGPNESVVRWCQADVKETPSELLAVAKELQTTAELARRFAVATLRQWKQQGDGALGEAPDMSSLEPLLDLLLAKALDEKEEEHMKQCCLQSLEGKHLLAQKSYIDLIHGSKTWVTGGLLYISSDEPKGNERMWGQKWRKIEDKGSLLDNAATQKALQSFKRLLSFHEKASGVPV
ncbi:unnamed protein product [Durusdinium trenchii]|uniref:Uncharacterized protein n=1 Tax=Durusdinium trenchii TaxID=1381693 RepID=A0ABP0N6C2_9DINO